MDIQIIDKDNAPDIPYCTITLEIKVESVIYSLEYQCLDREKKTYSNMYEFVRVSILRNNRAEYITKDSLLDRLNEDESFIERVLKEYITQSFPESD